MSRGTADPTVVDAPIVAVTVYPDRARVTRRGTVRLPAGEHRVSVEPLPLGLAADSVRVGGHGPATVLGVDVVHRRQPRPTEASVADLERRRRDLERALAELADADGVQEQVGVFLEQLARRSGATYARSLAAGQVDPGGLGGFADALADRLTAVRTRRRELGERRAELTDELAAVQRELAEVTAKRQPDRRAAIVTLAVAEDGDVELELSYVVDGAGWESAYDVRLVDEALTLTWYGLVRQRTGEDWPECDLRLSTARPAAAASLPDLDPWYLDRVRPLPPIRPLAATGGVVQTMAARTSAEALPPPAPSGPPPREVETAVSTVEQGVAAATYRPARPVAVPADGAAHRATVAAVELSAALDYVTAPVRSPDAYLRATVVNTSAHTLLPGRAAVFHGAEFVGSADLPVWAPGEEVELALGVDDRVRVERELVRRTASKATLGSVRRREVEYRTTVTNHTPHPARVTVLDQLPVSRDEQISVRELRADPEPTERGDMGMLTWRLELAPGQTGHIHFGLRVEIGKGVELAGWRE